MSSDDRIYNEACAEVYDQWFGACEEAAIDRLAELAGTGRVLELGIGSGLIALPLAARGIDLHGIDLSPAMVARLRAKPGGDAIPVTLGSFADVAVEGEFSLIFVAFNTFFALQTQDEQVRCFQNAAAHLADGGTFRSTKRPCRRHNVPIQAASPSAGLARGAVRRFSTSLRWPWM